MRYFSRGQTGAPRAAGAPGPGDPERASPLFPAGGRAGGRRGGREGGRGHRRPRPGAGPGPRSAAPAPPPPAAAAAQGQGPPLPRPFPRLRPRRPPARARAHTRKREPGQHANEVPRGGEGGCPPGVPRGGVGGGRRGGEGVVPGARARPSARPPLPGTCFLPARARARACRPRAPPSAPGSRACARRPPSWQPPAASVPAPLIGHRTLRARPACGLGHSGPTGRRVSPPHRGWERVEGGRDPSLTS